MNLKCILACLLIQLLSAQWQEPSAIKMTCQDAKFLSAEVAASRKTIEIEGVVTCVPKGWKGFFVSDSTGGVYCEAADSESESGFWPVQVGEKIVVRGVTINGNINSYVLVTSVIHREPSSLPLATALTLETVVSEKHDADLVSVRGLMVRITNIAGEMEYRLLANGRMCEVVHAGFRIDPKIPVYTEVEICGVVIPLDDNQSFKIVVPEKKCFRVLKTQEQVYADTPTEPLEAIVQRKRGGQLVRFQAQAYRVLESKSWLMQNGYGVEWDGKLGSSFSPGDSAEFVGLASFSGDCLAIEYGEVVAGWREPGDTITPLVVSEKNRNQSFTNRLVLARGTLVDRITIDGTAYLTFDAPDTHWIVMTMNPADDLAKMPLAFGATYNLTGLVTSEDANGQNRKIVLGDKSCIQFVSAPPLSPSHKLAFFIFLTAMMTLGLCISLISYRHLTKVRKRLELAHVALELSNESLETKIEERTKELQSINDALSIAECNARQANEAKSAFLANMSHEIRTPMTAILGYTEILKDDSELPPSDRKEFLETISRNGAHLLSVIDEILDLAKIESGKLVLDFQLVDPIALVNEAILLMQVRADAKNLLLEFNSSLTDPCSIWTDPTKLKQILLNLIGNAIKFTHKGSVSVYVAIELTSLGRIRIEVADSGIGISEEQIPKLFQPFEQCDNTLTRAYGGTGLGLSICQKLVTVLGGEISVRSKMGEGSCFQIVLPFKPAALRVNHFESVGTRGIISSRVHREHPIHPRSDVQI